MRSIIIGAFVLTLILVAPRVAHDLHSEVPPELSKEPATLLFVGDIMLARDVENYLDREGAAYPFKQISHLLPQYDAVIGNFEAVVSEPHVKALPFTFQFSVRPEYLKGLQEASFDILSLANNHSSDYGNAAIELTKQLCLEYGLRCVGDARRAETFVHEVHNVRLGFLFANTTWNTESTETLLALMREIATKSDIQIAYIHWGTEYELIHNREQQVLAEGLIDAGADAVIGHHPHVVQDVAFYKEKPIFYSLGNFIFDQYWNEHVQTGLGVEMRIEKDQIEYQAIPFTRKDSRNQPAVMEGENAEALLGRIFAGTGVHEQFTVAR